MSCKKTKLQINFTVSEEISCIKFNKFTGENILNHNNILHNSKHYVND